MNLMTPHAAAVAAAPLRRAPEEIASCIIQAAQLLLPNLERGHCVDAHGLRVAMETAFGASDAEGAWTWKDAYEACEAAQLLFLRKFGRAMRARATSPATLLAMLEKIATLLPSHTRRTEESDALQQFSTPITLGHVVSVAANLTPTDVVLEPSAGTGLLAIFAELAGARLALNEVADIRVSLLVGLFPGKPVTHHDAAQIHDYLDPAVRPSVVLINPPFSATLNVEGRMTGTAFRHMASALARLADGGRLVLISGTDLSPHHPKWRQAFVQLQATARLVFTACLDGSAYAKHGTTIDTRLTVIDKVPAEDARVFPAQLSKARNVTELLDRVLRHIPPRAAIAEVPSSTLR